MEIEARVSRVRDDGKLVLSARKKAYKQMNIDAEAVYSLIEDYEGVLPFTDKSDPELIKLETGLSKNAFKRAVGHLLKEDKIQIKENTIEHFVTLYEEYYRSKYNEDMYNDLYVLFIFNKTEFDNIIREKYNLNSDTRILTKFTSNDNNSDLEIYYINDKIETINDIRVYTIESIEYLGLLSNIKDLNINKGVVK